VWGLYLEPSSGQPGQRRQQSGFPERQVFAAARPARLGLRGQPYSQGMTAPVARTGARLAELLAALSLATDLGMGQSMEHMLRQCLIALRLAERLGLSVADRTVVYYASLLAWVGCHVDAYEQAKWLGDDTVLKTDFRRADFATAAARPLFMMRHLGAGRPAAERARLALAFLRDGRHAAESMLANHLVRNIRACRPCSAAPTATRNATVTFSASSSPVVRLMTALPRTVMLPPLAPGGLLPPSWLRGSRWPGTWRMGQSPHL
jgi:hypothetical protein